MNILLLTLLICALGTSVALVGGGGILVYALPGYMILGASAVLALFAVRRNNLRAGHSMVLSALLLGAYATGRALTSPVPYQAQMDLFMIVAVLTTYLLTAQFLTHPRLRSVVIGFLLLLLLVQAGIALVQFQGGDNFMLVPGLPRPNYGWRASGFYGCPNHFAGYTEIVVLFGLSMVLWSRWPAWLKLLTVWICLVGIVAQLMSGSRGGYLSLTAGLIVLGIASVSVVRRVSPHRFLLALAALVLAGGLIAGGVVLFAKHSQILTRRIGAVTDTNNMRLQLWQCAWDQSQISPATGTGAGTYLFYGRKFLPSNIIHDPIYVHNDYLHLLAEYGWIGAGLMLLFLGTHVVQGIRQLRGIVTERMAQSARAQSTGAALSLGAIAAVAALLVHSILDFNMHLPANALLMAFVFGLLANAGVRTETGQEGTGSRAFALFAKLLVPVLGAALLFMGVPRLRAEYLTEKARRAFDGQRYARAMGFALDSLAQRQDDPNVYYYLGWSQYEISLEQKSDYVRKIIARQAAETLGKGVQLMPQDSRLLIAYAHTLRQSDQYEEAERWYKEALRWDPNSGSVHARYGSLLVDLGRTTEARRELEKAQKLNHSAIAQEALKRLDKAAAETKAEAAAEEAARKPMEPLVFPAAPAATPPVATPSPLLQETRGF